VDVALKSAVYFRWIRNHEKAAGVFGLQRGQRGHPESLLQTEMRTIEGGGGTASCEVLTLEREAEVVEVTTAGGAFGSSYSASGYIRTTHYRVWVGGG